MANTFMTLMAPDFMTSMATSFMTMMMYGFAFSHETEGVHVLLFIE